MPDYTDELDIQYIPETTTAQVSEEKAIDVQDESNVPDYDEDLG